VLVLVIVIVVLVLVFVWARRAVPVLWDAPLRAPTGSLPQHRDLVRIFSLFAPVIGISDHDAGKIHAVGYRFAGGRLQIPDHVLDNPGSFNCRGAHAEITVVSDLVTGHVIDINFDFVPVDIVAVGADAHIGAVAGRVRVLNDFVDAQRRLGHETQCRSYRHVTGFVGNAQAQFVFAAEQVFGRYEVGNHASAVDHQRLQFAVEHGPCRITVET